MIEIEHWAVNSFWITTAEKMNSQYLHMRCGLFKQIKCRDLMNRKDCLVMEK